MQFFKNPFYLFVFAFLIIGLIYSLNWSLLYPVLSWSLVLFFVFAFIFSTYLGAIIDKFNPITYKVLEGDNIKPFVLVIYLLNISEFLYNGGIPLLMVFTIDSYDYSQYGIPVLHPLIATFTSFYTVYVFHLVLSSKFKKHLLSLFLLLTIPLLIYNRGMFLISLTSFLFVFLMSIRSIKFKRILWISAFVLLIFYGFGVLGNYRMVKNSSNDYFLKVSKASDSFKESQIPEEFLWSYIYISSPLANLQHNVNTNPPYNTEFKSFLFCELLPDFISKRAALLFNAKPMEKVGVADFLTVGTVFSKSYTALGWLGIFLMFFFLMALTFAYLILLKKTNKYYVAGIALINTFIVYNSFSNMIYFSGLSLQLVFPIILGYVTYNKGKLSFKKI